MAQPTKQETELIEHTTHEMQTPGSKRGAPLMRSRQDDLTVWQSVRRYKRVGFVAMAAAFCAALDGYRKTLLIYALEVGDAGTKKTHR